MKKPTMHDVHTRARMETKKRMKESGETKFTSKMMSFFRSRMSYWRERLLEL